MVFAKPGYITEKSSRFVTINPITTSLFKKDIYLDCNLIRMTLFTICNSYFREIIEQPGNYKTSIIDTLVFAM